MKKIVACALSALVMLSLVACQQDDKPMIDPEKLPTATEQGTSQDSTTTEGTEGTTNAEGIAKTHNTGSFSIDIPEGWLEVPVTLNNEPQPLKLIIGKGFRTEYDMIGKPYFEIINGIDNSFGDPVTNLEEAKDDFKDIVDQEPVEINGIKWDVFTAVDMGVDVTVYFSIINEQAVTAIAYFTCEGEPPTIDDADVQAILGSVAPKIIVKFDGTYTLYSMADESMDYEYILKNGLRTDLTVKQDGTIEMVKGEEVMQGTIDFKAETLFDGTDTYIYSYKDDTVHITDNAENPTVDMIFVNKNTTPELATIEEQMVIFQGTDYGNKKVIKTDTLEVPSEWYGVVTISDYQGDCPEDAHEYEANAILDYDTETGLPYFELVMDGYYMEDDRVAHCLLYLEDDSFKLIPMDDVGYLFDTRPSENAAQPESFAAKLENGVLISTSQYADTNCSFTLQLELALVKGSNTGAPADTTPKVITEQHLLAVKAELEAMDDVLNMEEVSDKNLTYDDFVADYMLGIEGEEQAMSRGKVFYTWYSIDTDGEELKLLFEANDKGELILMHIWG